MVPLQESYVKELASFCKERDILLIVDEVQTGIGRTGKLFSYEYFGIQPDIVTLAKGLGGGLPIGAVLLGGKVVADGPRDESFGNRALLKEVGIRPPEIFSMGQALEERALCYTVEEFTSCFGEGS